MKEPSQQGTEEEIQFVQYNYSPLCRVKGPPKALRPATFSPTSVYLGPVHKSGKNKITRYPSIKISCTSSYLFL